MPMKLCKLSIFLSVMLVTICTFNALALDIDIPDLSTAVTASVKAVKAVSAAKDAAITVIANPVTYEYIKPSNAEMQKKAADTFKKLNAYTGNTFSKTTGRSLELADNMAVDGKVTVRSDVYTFDMYNPATNGFVYSRSLSETYGKYDTPFLPKKLEATGFANKHLAALQMMPVAMDGEELYVSSIVMLKGAAVDRDGVKSVPYNKVVCVNYSRKLNGLRVVGESRIKVRLGTNGELFGVIKSWPTIRKVANTTGKNIHSAATLKNTIAAKLQYLYTGADFDKISITNVEPIMYDDGTGHIELAYQLLGSEITTGGETKNADWIFPAVTNYKAQYGIDKYKPVRKADKTVDANRQEASQASRLLPDADDPIK